MFVEDPSTGKSFLRLIRDDYDPERCRCLTSNIVQLKSYDQAALDGTVNQVGVTYHDSATNKDASITAQNLANALAQGADVAKQAAYPGAWNAALGARLAERDCRAQSALLATGEVVVQTSDTDILRGDVMSFSFTFGGQRVEHMPVRIIDVQDGKPSDKSVTIKFAQDIFGLPAASYIAVNTQGWTEPQSKPLPITAQVLHESSYRDLAARLSRANLDALDADAGYVGAGRAAARRGLRLHADDAGGRRQRLRRGRRWRLRAAGAIAGRHWPRRHRDHRDRRRGS